MSKKPLTFEEVIEYTKGLPYNKFKEVVESYSSNNGCDLSDELDAVVISDFQERLKKLQINTRCPKCNSNHIKKYGKSNHIQIYKCNNCNKKFTLFSGTILEKTHWHWDLWIKVLEMTINGYSLHSTINVLENDFKCSGINYKTVWLWRMKLIHALASMPMPTLTGIIQVDETFIRESQKGSRELVSYVSKDEKRKPRYGRRPSKLGVMGPEFATVTTAIDNRGYCVCKVSSLGRLTIDAFNEQFHSHFDNPAYICSDANDVYEQYCQFYNIPHYEKPSNYLKTIERNGYVTPDYADPDVGAVLASNDNVLEKLYNAHLIDRITNRGIIDYKDFKRLKVQNGLSLAKVNELHSDIKDFIYHGMTNVSTKFLQDYIGFFCYIRNWRVSHGRYPNSHKDAEEIFIEILKAKVNYTVSEVEAQEIVFPQPSAKYISVLKEETEQARKATANKYFKFGEEDGVKTFNKREYLLDQPKSKLYAIAKECGMTHYRKLALYSLVSAILKQPNIKEIIYKLLLTDRGYSVDDEDLEAIHDELYK